MKGALRPSPFAKQACKIYNDERELLVDGYTTHPFIGISGKPVRAPKSLLEALQPYFRADDLDLPSQGENGQTPN